MKRLLQVMAGATTPEPLYTFLKVQLHWNIRILCNWRNDVSMVANGFDIHGYSGGLPENRRTPQDTADHQ